MAITKYIQFLNDIIDEFCLFNDESITDMNREIIHILWFQIKIFIYRLRINDYMYNGKMLSSKEIVVLNQVIEKLESAVTKAQERYTELQQVVNNGGFFNTTPPDTKESEYEHEYNMREAINNIHDCINALSAKQGYNVAEAHVRKPIRNRRPKPQKKIKSEL